MGVNIILTILISFTASHILAMKSERRLEKTSPKYTLSPQKAILAHSFYGISKFLQRNKRTVTCPYAPMNFIGYKHTRKNIFT